MESGELLVGNVAIAAIVIKTLISAYRQMFNLSPMFTKISAVALGIVSAFILNASLFDIENTSVAIKIFQHVISGLFIGATAMGFHESLKNVKK